MTRRARARSLVPWILVAAAAVLPYVPACTLGFAFDDGGVIRENRAVWAESPGPAWTAPYWPEHARSGLYRPWVTFTYWLNAQTTGRGAAGFHATNVLLHAVASLLLWRLLRRLFPGREGTSMLAACLFAAHPLHSEAVTAIVGRAELWAAIWSLLAYRAALEELTGSPAGGPLPGGSSPGGAGRRALLLLASATCFALALLSKESAAGLLLLPPAHALLQSEGASWRHGWIGRLRRRLPVLAAWSVTLLLVLTARQAALGSAVGLDRPSLSDNVLAHVPATTRALSALGFQWILIRSTLFPLTLAADYSYPQLAPGAAWMAAGALLAAIFAIAVGRWLRRGDREALWGALFVIAAGAVTANVLLPVGTVLGERLAYLPSAGALWLLALYAGRLSARLRRGPAAARAALPVVLALWGTLLAARTIARNLDWTSDLRLFQATAQASPRSAKAWSNLAVAQLEAGDVGGALASSGRALTLLPDYPAAREIRATALIKSGRPEEAAALLRPALRETPLRPRTLVELGNAFLALSAGAPAESAFAAAARVAPPEDFHPAVGLASACALQGRWAESEAHWRRAVRLAPENRDIRRSWAFALWKSGAPDQAEQVYREILSSAPEDPSTLNDLAWFLLEERGDTAPALLMARRAFAARADETAGDTLLEALRRAAGCDAARAWIDSLPAAGRPPELVEAMRRIHRERCGGGAQQVP